MPVAAAAPALDALAFAFAAIAFGLIAYTLIINPLRGAGSDVSDVPVVGGALSWALFHLADIVVYGVDWVNSQVDAAHNQATGWWNWFVTNTIGVYYGDINGRFNTLNSYVNDLWSQAFAALPSQLGFAFSLINGLQSSVNGIYGTLSYVVGNAIPDLYAGINRLAFQATQLDARILAIEQTIARDVDIRLNSLESASRAVAVWEDYIGNQVIPRLRDTINERAFESEAEALRHRLGQAESVIAILTPLALLAVAGATAIENLRCQMDVPCDPLAQLAQADVDDRLNHLEISEG